MSSSKHPIIEISSDSSSSSDSGWKNYFPKTASSSKNKGKAKVEEASYSSDPLPSTPSSFEYFSSDDEDSSELKSLVYCQGEWETFPPNFPLTDEHREQMKRTVALLTEEMERTTAAYYKVPVPKGKAKHQEGSSREKPIPRSRDNRQREGQDDTRRAGQAAAADPASAHELR